MNGNLLKINEQKLIELNERLKKPRTVYESDAIRVEIDIVNRRIENIINGTHGW